MKTFGPRMLLSLLLGEVLSGGLHAQSLRKLERRAINRTRITLVNGDTIQRFTTTLRQPRPQPNRMYYWQGQDHVLRTFGAYNGHLLDGPYQLTDRADHLLGAGRLKKGLKTGTWRKWRADGSLASSNRWRRGRQRGGTISYDVNSHPLITPAPLKPTTVAAVPRAEPGGGRWWQLPYWKVKLKRRKTVPLERAIPASTAPATPEPTKKQASPKKKNAAPSKVAPAPVPANQTGT